MISLSESMEVEPSSPTRLLEASDAGVSRLLFESLEEMAARSSDSARYDDPAEILRAEMAALDGKLRSQTQAVPAQIEEARREARVEERLACEEEIEQRVAEERIKIVQACEQFDHERSHYFAAVEEQVVKLSLAIARQVLHREATMDPLLLAGAVRVALEKVQEESGTKLHVPVAEAAMWRALFSTTRDHTIEIVGDDAVIDGAYLETTVGTVELGIEAQLTEIERGFFDLLLQRPA